MALINDRPRGATIMSTEETMFAVMTKEDYQSILQKFTENKLNKQIGKLREFPIFAMLSRQRLCKVLVTA